MKQRLTLAEFRNWQAFYLLEPFGNDWRRTARQCAMIAAAAGARDLDEDSFLICTPPPEEADAEAEFEATRAWLGMWADIHGIPHGYRR